MNPSDYHFLCPQKWGNIGLTSAHNKIIEMKELYLSNCSKRQRERVIYSTFLLLFRDIDLAQVRPHFNPSLFCLPKMGETREHLLLYPFSDQKPNICCHRCSISNQLKYGIRYIRPFIKSWWRCMSVNVETNSHFLQSIIVFGFDDFLFYWFLCFMDYPWFTLGLINLWIQIYSNQFLFKIIFDYVFSFH